MAVGGFFFGSTVAAPRRVVARKNRGMAFEIARVGRLEWGVSAGKKTSFQLATVPPTPVCGI